MFGKNYAKVPPIIVLDISNCYKRLLSYYFFVVDLVHEADKGKAAVKGWT